MGTTKNIFFLKKKYIRCQVWEQPVYQENTGVYGENCQNINKKDKEEFKSQLAIYNKALISKREYPENFAQRVINWKNKIRCVEYAMIAVSWSIHQFNPRIIEKIIPVEGRFWA